jgi:acetyl-CoA carboxylase biotin carboxyl carrier protein
MKEIRANRAGLVVEFLVQPGETVTIDQDVVILESMKMYIPVQASAAGIVKAVKIKAGDVINDGDVLLELE